MHSESYLYSEHYDLVTPDGKITRILSSADGSREAWILFENISPAFVGYSIDEVQVLFNLKSTLAQLGLNAIKKEILLYPKKKCAEAHVQLVGFGKVARAMLEALSVDSYIGKLFAADERRKVRNPDYLLRMFGRCDRYGKPLLSLGSFLGSDEMLLEKIEGRTVAFLTLLNGVVQFNDSIMGFIPTIAKALKDPSYKMRSFLPLHFNWKEGAAKRVQADEILLVKTAPLHIRTVFARVVEGLLPQGYRHTSACILEPDTKASGDIYELYGSSEKEITDIPLEFYTLEPHREHVFFSDRDQLQICLEDPECLFKAFGTSPPPLHHRASVFVVKGDQLLHLSSSDWITREPHSHEFPGLSNPERQALMVDRYIQEQPAYPFLKAIEDGLITSQGILLSRHLPSPLMKRMLLSDQVQKHLKGIYFEYPSLSYGDFFSHEDRSMLLDLAKFGIPVYWLDHSSKKLLKYVPKPEKDTGMFVPLAYIDTFIKATAFGIYGSNLLEPTYEEELTKLLQGLKELSYVIDHPMLNSQTPIALITGGGPGVMQTGNQIAKKLNILSCANIVDFRPKAEMAVINEQKQNPYIDAKMTYRLDRLVERQAEFNLDFPIFLLGGIGTDFEFALEEVRRKVGASAATPVLLFGSKEYWEAKITSRFQNNLKMGTIAGSEWVSNCFFCAESASLALKMYRQYFEGNLQIGKDAPIAGKGFVILH